MQFVPGRKRTGGRAKGTPNKRTSTLQDILDAKGVNVLERILSIVEELPEHEKVRVYLELMNYLYPKRKATELTVRDEALMNEAERIKDMSNEELIDVAETELKTLKGGKA